MQAGWPEDPPPTVHVPIGFGGDELAHLVVQVLQLKLYYCQDAMIYNLLRKTLQILCEEDESHWLSENYSDGSSQTIFDEIHEDNLAKEVPLQGVTCSPSAFRSQTDLSCVGLEVTQTTTSSSDSSASTQTVLLKPEVHDECVQTPSQTLSTLSQTNFRTKKHKTRHTQTKRKLKNRNTQTEFRSEVQETQTVPTSDVPAESQVDLPSLSIVVAETQTSPLSCRPDSCQTEYPSPALTKDQIPRNRFAQTLLPKCENAKTQTHRRRLKERGSQTRWKKPLMKCDTTAQTEGQADEGTQTEVQEITLDKDTSPLEAAQQQQPDSTEAVFFEPPVIDGLTTKDPSVDLTPKLPKKRSQPRSDEESDEPLCNPKKITRIESLSSAPSCDEPVPNASDDETTSVSRRSSTAEPVLIPLDQLQAVEDPRVTKMVVRASEGHLRKGTSIYDRLTMRVLQEVLPTKGTAVKWIEKEKDTDFPLIPLSGVRDEETVSEAMRVQDTSRDAYSPTKEWEMGESVDTTAEQMECEGVPSNPITNDNLDYGANRFTRNESPASPQSPSARDYVPLDEIDESDLKKSDDVTTMVEKEAGVEEILLVNTPNCSPTQLSKETEGNPCPDLTENTLSDSKADDNDISTDVPGIEMEDECLHHSNDEHLIAEKEGNQSMEKKESSEENKAKDEINKETKPISPEVKEEEERNVCGNCESLPIEETSCSSQGGTSGNSRGSVIMSVKAVGHDLNPVDPESTEAPSSETPPVSEVNNAVEYQHMRHNMPMENVINDQVSVPVSDVNTAVEYQHSRHNLPMENLINDPVSVPVSDINTAVEYQHMRHNMPMENVINDPVSVPVSDVNTAVEYHHKRHEMPMENVINDPVSVPVSDMDTIVEYHHKRHKMPMENAINNLVSVHVSDVNTAAEYHHKRHKMPMEIVRNDPVSVPVSDVNTALEYHHKRHKMPTENVINNPVNLTVSDMNTAVEYLHKRHKMPMDNVRNDPVSVHVSDMNTAVQHHRRRRKMPMENIINDPVSVPKLLTAESLKQNVVSENGTPQERYPTRLLPAQEHSGRPINYYVETLLSRNPTTDMRPGYRYIPGHLVRNEHHPVSHQQVNRFYNHPPQLANYPVIPSNIPANVERSTSFVQGSTHRGVYRHDFVYSRETSTPMRSSRFETTQAHFNTYVRHPHNIPYGTSFNPAELYKQNWRVPPYHAAVTRREQPRVFQPMYPDPSLGTASYDGLPFNPSAFEQCIPSLNADNKASTKSSDSGKSSHPPSTELNIKTPSKRTDIMYEACKAVFSDDPAF